MAKRKTGFYTEADGRHVFKTSETYKGVTWICKGTSYESDAKAKISWQRNKEKRMAEIDGATDRKAGKIKLEKALPEWYDTHVRNKMTHGRPRSERTIQTDMTTINQISKGLGNINVCDVNVDVLQKYFNDLAAEGAGASTVRKQWLMLDQYFRFTDRKNNPMLDCHKLVTNDIRAQYEGVAEVKTAYSNADMERLTDALKRIGGVRELLLIVVMWQFLRIGEAIELRVRDIEFIANGNGIIHIRRQYDERNRIVTRPKDNSMRDIPISWRCIDIIQQMCKGKKPDALVFHTDGAKDKHDGRVLRSATLNALAAACKSAGIARHTVHDLRHDGISYYVRHGYKPTTIQRWAGHSSLSVTLDKYYRDTGEDDPRDLALMMSGKEPGEECKIEKLHDGKLVPYSA